jgi:NADH-quinone oxidoreductase subunit M
MTDFLQLLLGDSLTRLVFFPVLACLPLLLIRRQETVKRYTLAVALVELALVLRGVGGRLVAGAAFEPWRDLAANGSPIAWIPRFGSRYELMMDGISLPLVVLTALLLPIIVLGSWRGIDRQWRGYAASCLLLTSGILGAFLAVDLFLFYVFFELMLVPMYLMIGIWGGQRRVYAAIKFFIFTMAGSLLMLLAILWLAWSHSLVAGSWSFSYDLLSRLDFPISQQLLLFAAFGLAFAIKVPLVPLHTWLPDAHVEAPTGGSVVLAGVLLKLGTYGFLRFAMPLFPHAASAAQPLLITLALIGILYGALVAWVQSDMKKLVAYSSVAHLGFVVLGLFAFDQMAWEGALIQMVNHGLSTGALFLLVGMIYDRRHTKEFDQFGGLAKVMPWFATMLVISALASVGLPGLNGFVGEFLILAGSYRAGLALPVIAATLGVVLAAIYLLKLLARTLWGPLDRAENRELSDLSLREILTLAPLVLLMFAIGVAPERFLAPSREALTVTLAEFQERRDEPAPVALRLRDSAPLERPDEERLLLARRGGR